MTEPAQSTHQGLIVLQSNRTEDLLQLALGWLNRHPLHPLDRTVFLVQSNGIAQWLKTSFGEQQGEPGRGICLGTDVMLPARFQWEAYRSVVEAVEGPYRVPATSPFDKTRLRWRLLSLLPQALDDSRFMPLARYLEGDGEQRRHYQLAERLADLFDQYQVYRADWLNAWEAGRDILTLPGGEDVPIPREQAWQPALWRMIVAAIGNELAGTHRAAVHRRFLAGAAALPRRPASLPPRVVVFGISSLPRQVLEVLEAVSGVSEVILCLLNPCQYFWGELIETREVLRQYHRQQRRHGMPEKLHLNPELLHLHAHPLLAAWGKQGRDYLQLLAGYDATDVQAMAALQQPVDWFQSPPTDSLLGQLQDDILELRPLAETRETWPQVDPEQDASIRFHNCHSPQRELEVLHDQLLAAFDADASLQPRDIMVMVPDINDYAPGVDAVFGQFTREDARYIPYHVADQQQRHRQPMLVALETLLSLPGLRFRASEILDLLEIPPLRERFGLAESDLPTLQRWIRGANVRWGLDAHQRSELDLPQYDELHSWRFGLSRMLMGYAVGDAAEAGEDWAGVVPYDEVAGLDAALVGPLYRLVLTLQDLRERLKTPQVAAEWGETLSDLLASTLQPVSGAEQALLEQIRSALEAWQEEIEAARVEEPLSLAVVRESWLDRIDAPRLSQSFMLGRVTFATLMPMRAIPFRHIYLLGMNDGAYPRRADTLDFDLMAVREHYRAGDRSRRDDDRYLFLEALLSARECLSISWCGRSVKDNSEQPPSVLVGQLRDHLAAGWRMKGEPADGDLARALTTDYPLQPFADAYFRSDSGLFTYAGEWQGISAGAVAAAPSDGGLPPWWPETPVTLDQLAAFLRDPVAALFQQRLSTYMRDEDVLAEDDEPFAYDGLQQWQQREALLQPIAQRLARDRDLSLPDLLAQRVGQRQRAGDYPPAPAGPAVRAGLLKSLPGTLDAYRQRLALFPGQRQVSPLIRYAATVEWQGDERALDLDDTLDRVHLAGDGAAPTPAARIVLLSSRLHSANGKALRWAPVLRHWPAHLALQLHYPGAGSHLVSPTGTLLLRGMDSAAAEERLARLMQNWLQGMHRALPTHPEIAFAALVGYPERDMGAREPVDILSDDSLYAAFDSVHGQSQLLAREYPTLEALVGSGDFVAASLALYADFHAWVCGHGESVE